ncbi:hypothetical protein [Deinococcus humi]|uniref:Uncharacterized protein n=1 Tax=Deinococcus humi TaxID=662880 RepID=A0A7W8JQN1_9DEIO|nr:hypothetical protein [Deinococcus humi]MBB5361165.1 hypothetical protein [Deinococcus humi]GGO18703.1 hypothetical protein GCM10008949_02340 [Deinococcus humi]
MAHEASFQPSHSCFVLYDPHAHYDPDEAPLWDPPAEDDEPLSVRKTQLSVSCWDERDWIFTIFVGIEVFPNAPLPPSGEWPTYAEAILTIDSGLLAMGDIVLMESPEIYVPVPPGRVWLRVAGRPNPEGGLTFVIQVWPED